MVSAVPLISVVERHQADRLIRAISARVRLLAAAVGGALAAYGNPAYFQFERRGPIHTRVGPGVSHVSDSFWPLSEW
jgi:hypothetical protein